MNQLATVQGSALSVVDDMFSDARIKMIRDTVAKGAPNDVFAAMIDIAKRRGLDPLAKQIIVVQFGGTWTPLTTIDGYRAIAEQTGQYAGSDKPIFTYEDNIKTSAGKTAPDSAEVTVYKIVGGERRPFTAIVYWEEYAGRNNWNTMPRTMLSKVAESHALRKAFPSVLSGLYTREEMDQAGPIEAPSRVVNQQTGEITEPPAPRLQATVVQAEHMPDLDPTDVPYLQDTETKEISPARKLAIQDWYTAIDSTGIEREKYVQHWMRYKDIAGDVEDIPAGSLSNWANRINSNPQGAAEHMEKTIYEHAIEDGDDDIVDTMDAESGMSDAARAELYPTEAELEGKN